MCTQCPSCGRTHYTSRRFRNAVCHSCLMSYPITDCSGDHIDYANFYGYLQCRRPYDSGYKVCQNTDFYCRVGIVECMVTVTGDGSVTYVSC